MKANILVVDDTRDNLRLLSDMLTKHGYKIRPVSDGGRAISSAQSRPPDLILLDILMPGMDGYAVCQALKANEQTRDIPVIFLSALNETFDKVKAFSAGGVDYITKPFHPEEVLARVETHLRLCRMHQQVQRQNAQLQQEIAERQRAEEALRQANAAKDTFFSIIAHDLRAPFTGLLGYAELALRFFQTLSKAELKDAIEQINTSAEAVYALLENLLTWSRLQRGDMACQPRSVALQTLVEDVVYILGAGAKHKQIVLRRQIPDTINVWADHNMLNTIIRNLVTNALKFTEPGGRIEIAAQQHDAEVEISVTDTGTGIAQAQLPHLFRVDAKTTTTGTAGESGTGLGLPLCKDLAEKNGGSIEITTTSEQGTTITLKLPALQTSLPTGPPDSGPPAAKDAPLPPDSGSVQASSEPPQLAPSPLISSTQLSEALARLPHAWQSELRKAAEILNVTAATALIERIRPKDDRLAEALTACVREFRFDTLLETLENIPSAAQNTGKRDTDNE